ncbi:MAG: pyridoxamine 5'-phosphate oxidase family protein [Thermoplasmata archaeon]
MEETMQVIDEVYRANQVCVLGTSGEDGLWIASTYFAEDGTDFYCLLTQGTKTLENSKKDSNVAFCVDRQVPDKFLQGSAEIEHLPDGSDGKKKGEELLLAKIPEIAGFMQDPSYTICRISPTKVYVTDFSKGWFPAKVVEL